MRVRVNAVVGSQRKRGTLEPQQKAHRRHENRMNNGEWRQEQLAVREPDRLRLRLVVSDEVRKAAREMNSGGNKEVRCARSSIDSKLQSSPFTRVHRTTKSSWK